MDKRFLTILAALVVIFGGIFIFAQKSNEPSGVKGSATTSPSNHVIGEGAKNVTLVEYGDYQCQVCLAYEPTVVQVKSAYAKEVKFQFRHLPLTSTHPNAFAAARAAEAAGLQDKFWEMHQTLYNITNWQGWTNSSSPRELFNIYAQNIGLDMNKFQTDYASEQVNSIIKADLEEFRKTGQAMATPSFFVNGKYIENRSFADENGRPSFAKFKEVLDAEIAKTNPSQ